MRMFAPQDVPQNEGGTAQRQEGQDQNSAAAEKFLGQDVDDLVHLWVEQPVVLAGEEQGVEHHKGPVEIQRRQPSHEEERAAQPRSRPEGRPPAQGPCRGASAAPGVQKDCRQQDQRRPQRPQVQQKQHPHVGEMGLAALRPFEYAGGKFLRPQAVVQHLVERGFDFVLRQAGALLQLQRADVGVVERAAQDGDGHGGGEQGEGGAQSQQGAQKLTGFHRGPPLTIGRTGR